MPRAHDETPLGMMVAVQIRTKSSGPLVTNIMRNVTEIHYQTRAGITSFDSAFHGTGSSYDTVDIVQISTKPETEKSPEF